MKYTNLIIFMLIGVMGYVSLYYAGKASANKQEVKGLQLEVKRAKARLDVLVDEYNALQTLYDEGSRNKVQSQEKTDAAKKEHLRTGAVTRASESDARLLNQRSREVRGDTTDTSRLLN